MERTVTDYGNSMDMGGGMGEQEPDSDDELLQELLQAAQAGDDAEGEGFFSDVEGADPEASGDVKLEANGISPEQLQQLLEALKSGGTGGMG